MDPDPLTLPTPLTLGLHQLVGHEAARHWLLRSLSTGRLPHALLVAGPRGVGKRTLSLALAAHLFCRTGEACGSCAGCGALLRGNSAGLQMVSVPPDKNVISMAQVREMIRVISLRTPDARGRVTLIRDADRMAPEAQDALLKTVEEPPPGNRLILLVERREAVLPTLRSRCQRLELGALSDAEMRQVAERLGVTPLLPLPLARGCPGRLAELASEDLRDLRRAVLWALQGPLEEDLARWTCVVHQGLPAKSVAADVRGRARVALRIVNTLVRDLVCLAASDRPPMILHQDLEDDLRQVACQPEWADPAEVLARLAHVRTRLEGFVDPVASLAGIRRTPNDDLACMGELLNLE